MLPRGKQAAPGAGQEKFGAVLRCAVGGDAGDGPDHAAQRNAGVVVAYHIGAGKRQRGLLVAVDHAVDDVGALGVGGGSSVNAEQDDAQGAAFERDDVDVEVFVGLDLLGEFLQVIADALVVEVSLHDLAVASFMGGIGGRVAVVDGERGVVEVAFGLEAGLLDEVFVFGLARLGRLLAEIGEQAHGLKVDVENGVGVGEEADGVRSGALAEENGEGNCAEYEYDAKGDPEDTATLSHG